MRLIKRYSNRKLYDTEMRSYITLDGLAALIAEGIEIKVVDNDTEEDLTSVVLSQILLERERVQRFVPSAVLSQLLRGGENLGRSLSKVARPFVTQSPLPIPQILEQEIEKSLKFWAELGQNGEEETLRLLESWIEKRRRVRSEPESNVSPVTRRSRTGLDNFEEWGGDRIADPVRLPVEPVVEYLKATHDLVESLAPYAENTRLLNQEEVEKLNHKLDEARLRLNQLYDELNHS